ncbi:MAG: M48 family metallopeptidase [Pseudomonadota bacterium]
MRFFILGFLLVSLAGCVTAPTPTTVPASADIGTLNFGEVAARVEAVSEAECRARLRGANCDFVILIEQDPRAGVNAFQTLDRGRPLIIVTAGLLEEIRNADELAFVIGHEAAHHIRQHIPQQVDAARRGALVFGVLAEMGGADDAAIREAAELGAVVGARRYSQEHELEADQLGTIIAARSGFDPVRGAQFFDRLPDPGNRFLGTHPPNAVRQEMVRATAAAL